MSRPGRTCTKGHALEPNWAECPYCEAERRSHGAAPQSEQGASRGEPALYSRVFISSTTIDLKDYRQATFRAIQSLGGYGDDMVYWSADERSGATVSLDRVHQSDVLILLVAHRYGYVPEGSTYSITEMEYRAARAAGIPVLAFVVDDDVPWPPKFIERERAVEMSRFKELVTKEVTWRPFHTPDELMALVTQALVPLATRLPFRPTIHLTCSEALLPIAVTPGQTLYVLETRPGQSRGFTQFSYDATTTHWPPINAFGFVFRCEVRNYGKQPVINVQIPLQVVFSEAIKGEDGAIRTGNEVQKHTRTASVPDLDDPFVFYISNPSVYVADVLLPEYATLQVANEQDRRSVAITTSPPDARISLPPG